MCSVAYMALMTEHYLSFCFDLGVSIFSQDGVTEEALCTFLGRNIFSWPDLLGPLEIKIAVLL